MVVVAVAGTGGVGRTVLDAIAASGEHNAIVLSRTVSSPNAIVFVQKYLNHNTLFRQRPTNPNVLPWIIAT